MTTSLRLLSSTDPWDTIRRHIAREFPTRSIELTVGPSDNFGQRMPFRVRVDDLVDFGELDPWAARGAADVARYIIEPIWMKIERLSRLVELRNARSRLFRRRNPRVPRGKVLRR